MYNLDFSKQYVLEANYVRLRPLRIEDVKNLSFISNKLDKWTYFIEKGSKNLIKCIQSTIAKRKQ